MILDSDDASALRNEETWTRPRTCSSKPTAYCKTLANWSLLKLRKCAHGSDAQLHPEGLKGARIGVLRLCEVAKWFLDFRTRIMGSSFGSPCL